MSQLAIIVLVISALVSQGWALECYACISGGGEEGDCGRNFDASAVRKQTCTGTDPVCYVARAAERQVSLVFRGCFRRDVNCAALADRLNQTRLDDFRCITCEKDLCNSSSAVMASVATILMASLLAFFK